METAISELAKYAILCFFVLFTMTGFAAISKNKGKMFYAQRFFMLAVHALAYIIFFVHTKEMKYLIFYVVQLIFFIVLLLLYDVLYPKMSKLIINNMCMFLITGFIMISRIAFSKAVKQFAIVIVSCVISMFIPYFIKKLRFLSKLVWVYAVVGIIFLALMKLAGSITYGASITFSVGGVTIQPVEFVKIIFVFFLASFLSRRHDLKAVIVVSAVAAVHVLLLVWAKELGGALIFCMVYLCLVYVATRQPLYFAGAAVGGGAAAFIAYQLFNHVRVRVQTWSTPFSVIKNDTSQISQALFAIGTGGWFGLGLMEGIPHTIPVSSEDMIFAAITEELGMCFSLCIILICLTTFIMFINIATKIRDPFYKLMATGFGVQYIFQVFLTIGGGTKFIPLTGVTLPLISYGGSSVLCSLIIFHVIQGIYVLKQTEGEMSDSLETDGSEYNRRKGYVSEDDYGDDFYGDDYDEEDEDGYYDDEDDFYGKDGGSAEEYDDDEYDDEASQKTYPDSETRRRAAAKSYEQYRNPSGRDRSFDEYAVTDDQLHLDIPDEYFDE